MRVLLVPNMNKPDAVRCTRSTVERLLELRCVPLLDKQHREQLGRIAGCIFGDYSISPPEFDVLMPIGGDGTIIQSMPLAVRANRPILGVNSGRLGFLTQLDMGEIDKLELMARGEYTIQTRSLLEAVVTKGRQETRHLALNDVVVSKGDAGKMADMEVLSDGKLIARHRADGIIFSTPTGSTAYSLSAGGPVVHPEMSLILMTAICPHSTFNHSAILPSEYAYRVHEQEVNNRAGLHVAVDGERVGSIHMEEYVLIRTADIGVQFIDLGLRDFYTNLNEKLNLRR